MCHACYPSVTICIIISITRHPHPYHHAVGDRYSTNGYGYGLPRLDMTCHDIACHTSIAHVIHVTHACMLLSFMIPTHACMLLSFFSMYAFVIHDTKSMQLAWSARVVTGVDRGIWHYSVSIEASAFPAACLWSESVVTEDDTAVCLSSHLCGDRCRYTHTSLHLH